MASITQYTALLDEGKAQEAESVLKTIQENPGQYNLTEQYVHLQFGVLYQNHLGQPDKAIEHFKKSLALNPNSGIAHYNLGVLLLSHARDHVAAREELLKAHSLGYFWSCLKLARLLEHQFSDYSGAEKFYSEALTDGRPQSKLYYARFLRKHKPSENEAIRVNYMKVEPSHFDPLKVDEGVYNEDVKRNFAKASQHYERVIAAKPSSTFARFNLALLLKDSIGDLDKAKQKFEELIAIDHNYCEVHVKLAEIADVNKDFEEARKHFSEVLRINPEHDEAKRFLALDMDAYVALRKRQDEEKANADADYESSESSGDD